MQGFTLVELVVAVTILGLILVPLTAAATFFITHGADTTGVFADDTSIRSVISLFTTDARVGRDGDGSRSRAVRRVGERARDDDLDRRRHGVPGLVVDADLGLDDHARSPTLHRHLTGVDTARCRRAGAADGELFAELRERVDDHDDRNGRERSRLHGLGEAAVVMSRREETGASLLLALVFITCLGFMAIISLNIAESSFRDDQASQTLRADVYGGSGALDVYINAMRSTAHLGSRRQPVREHDDGPSRRAVGHRRLHSGDGQRRPDRRRRRCPLEPDRRSAATVDSQQVASARAEFVDGGGVLGGASVRDPALDHGAA